MRICLVYLNFCSWSWCIPRMESFFQSWCNSKTVWKFSTTTEPLPRIPIIAAVSCQNKSSLLGLDWFLREQGNVSHGKIRRRRRQQVSLNNPRHGTYHWPMPQGIQQRGCNNTFIYQSPYLWNDSSTREERVADRFKTLFSESICSFWLQEME